MKNLKGLLTNADNEAGVLDIDTNDSPEKIIKCSNCGATHLVPGYIVDYICRKCKTKKEMNNDLLTSPGWNLARTHIKVKKKEDRVIPAIARLPDRQDKTDDQT